MRVFEEQAVELVFRIFPLALRGSMLGENNITSSLPPWPLPYADGVTPKSSYPRSIIV